MSYPFLKDESYTLLGGINNKASKYVNDVTEFRDLTNLNFFVPGALAKRPGSGFYIGATTQGSVYSGYEFEKLNGHSFLIVSAGLVVFKVNDSLNSFDPIQSNVQLDSIFDFESFVDQLFFSNGDQFFIFGGTNVYAFAMQAPTTGGGAAAAGGSLVSVGTTLQFASAFVTSTGDISNCSPVTTAFINPPGTNSFDHNTPGLPIGTTFSDFGIIGIRIYRTEPSGSDLFGVTTFSLQTGVPVPNLLDDGAPLSNDTCPEGLLTLSAPRFLEIYNNQLFFIGFSSAPSTAYWSEVGQPRTVDPTFFNEFRTNDGDFLTGAKDYLGSLIVSKQRSLHRVTGDDPTNFTFSQITDQYGCLSNRTMVVYNDYLWFLDRKGIAQYDGARVSIISDKVEDIFEEMNLSAALNKAVAVNYRRFNEIWFAIPCFGATFNNTIVVYDYLVNRWTKYEGLTPASLFLAKGRLEKEAVFIGGYSGTIAYTDPSFYGDLGEPVTCRMDSVFLSKQEQTVTKQYRRFYLDIATETVGVSQPIQVDFKINYDETNTVLSRTMYQDPFQSRIDFGIPAKSIQATITHVSASLPLRIDGFTFYSRYQRNT